MKFILFLLTLYSANLIADEYDQLSVNITQEKEENMANKYRMNVSSKSFCGLAANYDHFLKVAEEYCKKNHALLTERSFEYSWAGGCDKTYFFKCDPIIDKVKINKNQCASLGYKEGTEKFANCVLELTIK